MRVLVDETEEQFLERIVQQRETEKKRREILAVPLRDALCLFCKHFYFHTGQEHYSDLTPGYNAEMGCNKELIRIDLNSDSVETYRKTILTARVCPEYET